MGKVCFKNGYLDLLKLDDSYNIHILDTLLPCLCGCYVGTQ